jgi:hypothetical protein
MAFKHGSSAGLPTGACTNRKAHRPSWVVTMRNYNASAFNGYRPTRSAYSEVRCTECRGVWRTKAAYVAELPDAPGTHRQPYLYSG